MFGGQALEIMRCSPVGICAVEWRKVVEKHERDVGLLDDGTLQFLLRRRSGDYDDTDSDLEIWARHLWECLAVQRQTSEEMGADNKAGQESSRTALNSNLTGVSVDCQLIRWCIEISSVEQTERAKTRVHANAVHVIANQGWHGKNRDLAGRLIQSSGHWFRALGISEESRKALKIHHSSYRKQTDAVMPRRSNHKTKQSAWVKEDVDGKQVSMRRIRDESTGSVNAASRDWKNRDEPTGTPDVEIGMSGQLMSSSVTGLATIGACGSQRKGVGSLVLTRQTPGPVVRKQHRLCHFAEIDNMRNWPSGARWPRGTWSHEWSSSGCQTHTNRRLSIWKYRIGGWRHVQKYLLGTREAHEGETKCKQEAVQKRSASATRFVWNKQNTENKKMVLREESKQSNWRD